MAIYVFKADDGEQIERSYSFDNAPPVGKRITVNGKRYTRILSLDGLHTTPPSCWPKTTVMDGVCAHQAKDLSDYLKNQGVPTEVTPDGSIVLRDRAHRRAVNRARGLHDMDGGYSD